MTIEQIETLCAAAPPNLKPLPQDKLVIYGAGHKGREILDVLRNAGHVVDAFIDQRQIADVDGLSVFQPDDENTNRFVREGYTVIIGVFNFTVDPLGIHALLAQLGFTRIVGIAELRQHFRLGETYWLGKSSEMVPSVAIAQALCRRLKDSESTATLLSAISLRRTLEHHHLRKLSAFDQYAAETVPTPRKQLRFVDGGAYDGDTLRGLSEQRCGFDAVAAFEPDPRNFAKLAANVWAGTFGQEVALFPCGLGARTDQVRFRSQGLSSSSISPDGDAIIQILAFDECMPRFRPNYVKLDIEGAEASALKGMARTIQSSRPALAVCVYHKPADLWEIPMLIDELLPESNFYLRAHAWNGFDLVFYAVPHEMARA
jgi:FkbM family methyltransferase